MHSALSLLKCMCKNAIFSRDQLNGFRCCLLWCLVSKSQVQECGDCGLCDSVHLTKDCRDAVISATICLHQSAISKPSFVSLIP